MSDGEYRDAFRDRQNDLIADLRAALAPLLERPIQYDESADRHFCSFCGRLEYACYTDEAQAAFEHHPKCATTRRAYLLGLPEAPAPQETTAAPG